MESDKVGMKVEAKKRRLRRAFLEKYSISIVKVLSASDNRALNLVGIVKILSASDNRALKGYGFAYDLNAVKLVVQINEGSVSWILG